MVWPMMSVVPWLPVTGQVVEAAGRGFSAVNALPGFFHAHLADVTLNPQPTQLPGGSALQNLTNGLGGWALILSLVGLLIGAASWALGAHTQNYQQSFFGRRAVLVSGLAALLIGAAPALINFFFHTGLSVH